MKSSSNLSPAADREAINAPDTILIRRLSSNLSLCGLGYMAFGAWSVVRTYLFLSMNPMFMQYLHSIEPLAPFFDPEYDLLRNILMGAIFSLMALFIVTVHVLLGAAAIRFAEGKKKSFGFIIWAVLIIWYDLHQIPKYFDGPNAELPNMNDTTVASLIADLTVIFTLGEIVWTTIRLRLMSSGSGTSPKEV